MQFLITDDARRALAVIDVPDTRDGESTTIGVERADRPDLLYVGADLYNDGTVTIGHWPDGEHWDRLTSTTGIPDACGHATPALPAEPTYTRAQITQALANARTHQASPSDANVLNALAKAALDSHSPQGG